MLVCKWACSSHTMPLHMCMIAGHRGQRCSSAIDYARPGCQPRMHVVHNVRSLDNIRSLSAHDLQVEEQPQRQLEEPLLAS